jgi:hypothetical protein
MEHFTPRYTERTSRSPCRRHLPDFCPMGPPDHLSPDCQASAPQNTQAATCQPTTPQTQQTTAHPPALQATACLPTHRPLPATGGLQHHQTPAPNLPRRCRKTGLDAKGVTPELLRLKFYCSWIRGFFFSFLFSLSVCLVCCLIVHHISLLISLVLHFFSFSSFLFLFFLLLSWFC